MAMLEARNADGDIRPVNDRTLMTAVRPVQTLDVSAIGDMFDLYAAYYDGTSRELFERDLRDKDHVVTLHNEGGALVGFSTLAVLDVAPGGDRARALYSGDTIIDRPYWGTQALAFTWLRFAGSIKGKSPDRQLYWFLIVKGHRTYRYLSTFSIDFFPHWNVATPRWAQEIIDSLARQRFAENYDARRGVVSFPQSRGHLKEKWASIGPEEAVRLDVGFFLRKNAGYVRGDELVCLTELSPDNLRPLARRIFRQGMGE